MRISNGHRIVEIRQAEWHQDAADDRRLRGADETSHANHAASPDPGARRRALLFHSLRRRISGPVHP